MKIKQLLRYSLAHAATITEAVCHCLLEEAAGSGDKAGHPHQILNIDLHSGFHHICAASYMVPNLFHLQSRALWWLGMSNQVELCSLRSILSNTT